MEEEEATQLTQGLVDPRRTGADVSTLGIPDVADLICILHPSSPAAYEIATRTAARRPQHVLQHGGDRGDERTHEIELPDDQETFILPGTQAQPPLDLALRFSSETASPGMGFLFGRSIAACDFVLDTDTIRRISNVHFRIFFNHAGVLMLQDVSTNGTLVDGTHLRGKLNPEVPETRMLTSGSVIQVLSQKPEENLKFVARIPPRTGHEEQYLANIRLYLDRAAKLEQLPNTNNVPHRMFAAVPKTQPTAGQIGGAHGNHQTIAKHDHGMKWDGGAKYNVYGHLGKGAFATVYQLATKSEGFLYAAKELEKRRFMKNGILDRKLDNEMKIMKDLTHRNIVQYIEYFDHTHHLYIIMEYVPFGDLQQYMNNNGSLPEPMGKTMAFQILNALSYLHSKRITHRDIKPDNILIANNSPEDFWVKLSDFGLSKVVKDNETFLKTFCGTLLYCAPEVFPHYDAHIGRKRPRRGANGAQRTYHSYSQSVDVWSFGAVLWYALCGKVPFEGVVDATGGGMFEKIMRTRLDPAPLRRAGISPMVDELLLAMLSTDPAERPSAAECLGHSWFDELRSSLDPADSNVPRGLMAIDEAVELQAEPDLSQLKIHEDTPSNHGEAGLNSSDFDFLDPRQSKRFKEYESPGQRYPSSEVSPRHGLRTPFPHGMPRRPILYGEVSESLQDPSALELGHNSSDVLSIREIIDDYYGGQDAGSPNIKTAPAIQPDTSGESDVVASTSLSGAELMVKELNVDSPRSSNSMQIDSDDPRTPRTPYEPHNSSLEQVDGAHESPAMEVETTPKNTVFNRQLDLPLSASFFYDPHDASTHNPEYASALSGHDFVTNPTAFSSSFVVSANLSSRSLPSIGPRSQDGSVTVQETTSADSRPAPEFLRPAPRLGRLVSTSDSFADITIPIFSQITTWGRNSHNTVVYPDVEDIRVPKRGLILYFAATGLKEAIDSGEDWTKLPDLQCLIATEARQGIYINGVKLMKQDARDRHLWGRIHSGDVITITAGAKAKDGRRGSGLEFMVELFHGLGKEARVDGDQFVVEIDRRAARN